jgi:hypothetical protein
MYSEPSKKTRESRSGSMSSTSSKKSQERFSLTSKRPKRPPLETAPLGQDDNITAIPSSPNAPQSEPPKLHGVQDLEGGQERTLRNKYGKFEIGSGVGTGGQGPFYKNYSADIKLTPSFRTRSSESLRTHGSDVDDVDMVQVVRSGFDDGWKTTAKDHGWTGATDDLGKPIDEDGNPKFLHRAELTEQKTGTGLRVDQAMYDTPFHSDAHTPDSVGRHHFTKKSDPVELSDKPAIAGPGHKFDVMTTAMKKRSGKELGTVEWGFKVGKNEQGESTFEEHPPTFLEDNLKLKGQQGKEARARKIGRDAAFDQWNLSAPGKEQANRENYERRLKERAEQEEQLKALIKAEERTEERAKLKELEEQLKQVQEAEPVKPPKQVTRIPGRG